MAVSAIEKVRKLKIDQSRLELVDEKSFDNELSAYYGNEEACERLLELLETGEKVSNPNNSAVGFVFGVTDELPSGKPPVYFDNDLPDIDIDFSDQKRQLVFDYMIRKYGSDRVARLGTVAMFKPRSALQEAAGALRIPKWKCDKVADSLIERSSGDSRALNTLEDTLKTMPAGQELLHDFPEVIAICKMEGHPRHFSQHAAGMIITEKPTSEYVAVDHRSGATMCDKKDAEELDLLKIDALGLTQLSVFEDALEMAGLSHADLESIPMDDEAAFEVLNKGHFSGIFQFNGMALQGIVRQFKVTEFNDIVSVTALGRPGPMSSGGAAEWVKRRKKEHQVTFPHPIFEPYLSDTLGIVLYQEQVMEIGRQVGGLDWGQVTALRKAMSKSLGKEYFDQFGDPWKKVAIAKGVDPKDAEKVWDDLCLSGDTVLLNPFPDKGSYKYITLKQLFDRGGLTRGHGKRQSLLMWDGASLKPYENWGVSYSGKKQTYTLKTESGNTIHATEEHKFLQKDGSYIRLKDLVVGGHVMSDSGPIPTKRKMKKGTGRGGHNWWNKLNSGQESYAKNREYLNSMFNNCQCCKESPYEETHHIDMNHENNKLENLLPVCRKCHKKLHAVFRGNPKAWEVGFGIFEDEIVSIEPRMVEDVYDIHMPAPHHNFLAEGIVVHNCAYGSWSFNKSHSVAYGIISYQCCWLKAHYPFEFAAATLSHEDDPARQLLLLREMALEGYDYIPVDEHLSTDKWTVGERHGKRFLVGPLSNVKGIGPKMVQAILGARARGERIPERARKLLTNPKTNIDSLFPIKEKIHELMPNPAERQIFTPPTNICNINPVEGDEQTVLVFATFSKINPRDENEAVNVAKRGYKLKGELTTSLNLQITDDTDTIFGKVNRFKYAEVGKPIVDRGRPGKALYAIKGKIWGRDSFRMINVDMVRYLGDMDQ